MSARIRLHDEAGPAVLVEKVATRNGHRMAITSVPTGRTARLDPLELECLTWQDSETFRRWAATISTVHDRGGSVPDDEGGDTLELANEFATVLLHKVLVGRTEHLDVVARKLGTRTRLDVTMLQGVAAQAPETFTELLASPFGAGAG